MTGAAFAVAAAASAGLGWMYRRDRRQAAAGRRAAFDDCRGLLEGAELLQDGPDYPALTGRRGGYPVELRLLADTIQLRKLPVLWLIATIRRPLKAGGVFDVMVRPDNTEYYSAHDRLRHVLRTPSDWPEQAVARCERPEIIAPLMDLLGEHVRGFFADGRGKELFLAPRGLGWSGDRREPAGPLPGDAPAPVRA